MEFTKYLNFLEIIKENKIIYLPESFDWVKGFSLPDIQLDLPSIERSGTVKMIMDKVNPIYVGLSDGSKLFFTIDEFKRIEGEPAVGKKIVWKMQRLPYDSGQYPSRIISCKVV